VITVVTTTHRPGSTPVLPYRYKPTPRAFTPANAPKPVPLKEIADQIGLIWVRLLSLGYWWSTIEEVALFP